MYEGKGSTTITGDGTLAALTVEERQERAREAVRDVLRLNTLNNSEEVMKLMSACAVETIDQVSKLCKHGAVSFEVVCQVATAMKNPDFEPGDIEFAFRSEDTGQHVGDEVEEIEDVLRSTVREIGDSYDECGERLWAMKYMIEMLLAERSMLTAALQKSMRHGPPIELSKDEIDSDDRHLQVRASGTGVRIYIQKVTPGEPEL